MSQSDGEAWMPVANGDPPSVEIPKSSGSLWTVYQEANEYMYQIADRRSRDLFLLGRMDGMLMITAAYLLFVLYLGPRFMKNRKAFGLRGIMLVYNICMVGLSAWMFLSFVINSQISGYNFWCMPYEESYEPSELRIVNALWWFYISKGIEYMDTIFMVLKKKQDQVSFLHVYHHIVMFPCYYFIMMLGPCCQAIFGSTLNSFIHILMYAYYAAAIFPALHKFLWWKRYLTQLQLLQFVAILTVTIYGYCVSCNYPWILYRINMFFMVSLIVLFSNFYIQSYIQRKRDRSLHSGKHHPKSKAPKEIPAASDNSKTDEKLD